MFVGCSDSGKSQEKVIISGDKEIEESKNSKMEIDDVDELSRLLGAMNEKQKAEFSVWRQSCPSSAPEVLIEGAKSILTDTIPAPFLVRVRKIDLVDCAFPFVRALILEIYGAQGQAEFCSARFYSSQEATFIATS